MPTHTYGAPAAGRLSASRTDQEHRQPLVQIPRTPDMPVVRKGEGKLTVLQFSFSNVPGFCILIALRVYYLFCTMDDAPANGSRFLRCYISLASFIV